MSPDLRLKDARCRYPRLDSSLRDIRRIALIAVIILMPLVSGADPLKLDFTASLEEKYSDNVFLDADNEASDFITIFSPAITGGWRTARADFSLSARPRFYDYRDTSALNAVDQQYEGRFNYQWSERLLTDLSIDFLDDEHIERELADTGLLFNESQRQRWSLGLTGQYMVSEATAMAVSCGYLTETINDPLEYDLDAPTISILFSRNLMPFVKRSTGRLQLGYVIYDYARAYSHANGYLTTDVDDKQRYKSGSMTLGLTRDITERLSMTLDLGARLTNRKYDVAYRYTFLGGQWDNYYVEETDSWGVVSSLEAAYDCEKSRMSLLVSHDLAPGSGRDGATERTTLRLADDGRLVNDWYYNLAVRAYRNRTESSRMSAGDDDITVQVSAGLRYAIATDWRIGADWRTTWMDDRNAGDEKLQNTVSLRLIWHRPVLE